MPDFEEKLKEQIEVNVELTEIPMTEVEKTALIIFKYAVRYDKQFRNFIFLIQDGYALSVTNKISDLFMRAVINVVLKYTEEEDDGAS